MKKYFLGIDGGGTKTVAVLIDKQKNEIFRGLYGTININGTTEQKANDNLSTLLEELPHKSEIEYGFIGIAGISNHKTKEFLKAIEQQGKFPCDFSFVGDHIVALKGALENEDGILLISGTGSICVGKDSGGNLQRAGGMGHIIDDVGSGYAIGRDILSAVVKSVDGRTAQTSLTQAVFNQLNISTIEELIGFVYSPERSKKDIASLAKLLPAHYQNGDSSAIKIRDNAALELVSLCVAVANKTNKQKGVVALSGSIIQKDDGIREKFEQYLKKTLPLFKPISPKNDAAIGAAMLAKEEYEKTT